MGARLSADSIEEPSKGQFVQKELRLVFRTRPIHGESLYQIPEGSRMMEMEFSRPSRETEGSPTFAESRGEEPFPEWSRSGQRRLFSLFLEKKDPP